MEKGEETTMERTRIAQTMVVEAPGLEPCRVLVCVENHPTSPKCYSTNIECVTADRGNYLLSGHYGLTVSEAFADMGVRLLERTQMMKT